MDKSFCRFLSVFLAAMAVLFSGTAAFASADPCTPTRLPTVTDDGDCTAVTTQLHFTWRPSSTSDTIPWYQYAIGIEPYTTADRESYATSVTGGWLVKDYVEGDPEGDQDVTVTSLTLSVGTVYYISVRYEIKTGPSSFCWSLPGSSDGIEADSTAPTGSIVINGGDPVTASRSVVLTLSASDTGCGVAEMRFSNDNATWSSWEAYGSSWAWTLSPGDGEKTVYVQYRDSVLNVSASYSDTITLQSPPDNVLCVTESGSGSKDGSDWDNAEDSIQDAINRATSGDEVWVAAGVHTERITLKNGVALYGGFSGSEWSRDQRDWRTNETVVDGNLQGKVVTVPSGAGLTTVLDGFTIRNGSATYGGGIYCSGASATIANNTIRSNAATAHGGGVYCSSSSATIANNIIRSNNAAGYGGGLYASASTLTVAGNAIVGNRSSLLYGGGIYYSNSGGQIANNTIISNAASSGGGIYLSSSSPALSNNIVSFNAVGGISKSGTCTPTFEKNDVYGNGDLQYSWIESEEDYPVGNDLVPVDPGITNIEAGDWHIASDSACRDTGASVSGVPDEDIDGEDRPYNSTPMDIGADEWSGSNPSPMTPITVYVKPDGSDSNNGTSWTLAAATVQKGIDLAYAAGGGEVWVAGGTYVKGTGATTVASLRPFVKLYGGFEVGDSLRTDRDWNANQTILDGGASGSVVTIRAVGCVVDGFVLQNGSATTGGGNGGGIYCDSSSATVANNTIRANSALASGAGIYCKKTCATLANNIIRANNSSSYGAGLYVTDSTLAVVGNVILGNRAGNSASFGGGVYCYSSGGQISNNTIISNIAQYGGGICLSSSSPAVSNNIVSFNAIGGIYKSGTCTPTFEKNDVYGNGGYAYSGLSKPENDLDPETSDPKITNIEAGDWHIADDSACNDTGATISGVPDKDIDGENRPYPSTPTDIGADEWSSTNPSPMTPITFYVKPNGSDSNAGTSWTLAVATVQKGIDLAYAAGGGEVWVAEGTYTKGSGATRVADLRSFTKVYGGFEVGDSLRSDRDWKANQTILDGGASGSVVTIRAVGCLVDGFVIQNGSATYEGGGIYCNGSSATIANNIIRANNSSSRGGGLYAYCSTLTVVSNVAVRNGPRSNSSWGGGIYYDNVSGQIANNTIIDNAAKYGGGIYLTSSSPALSNNIVSFNAIGGIYKNQGAPTFQKNNAYGNGGYAYSWTSWSRDHDEIGDDLDPVISDPKMTYIGWGDWHIAADSACKDAGADVSDVPDEDIDGEDRTYNSTPVDIGADEWSGTPLSFPDPSSPDDSAFNYDRNGNRTESRDSRGITHYDYDVLGRVIKVTDPDGKWVAYEYDLNDNCTKMTTHSDGTPSFNHVTQYVYNDRNLLWNVYDQLAERDASGDPTPSAVFTEYVYRDDALLDRILYPNGTKTVYSYNSNGDITVISNQKANGTIIAQCSYTYDPTYWGKNGTRTSVIEDILKPNGSRVSAQVTYAYDDLYRLVGEKRSPYGGGDAGVTYNYQYVYDDAGNRTGFRTMDQSGSELTYTSYSYDAANKMTGPGAFTYDDKGNLRTHDTVTYTWNYLNQLTRWEKTGQTTQDYVYNADGIRVRITPQGGTATDFLLDGAEVVEAVTGTGNMSYVAPGVISGISGTTRTVYHPDGIGSTRATSRSDQAVQEADIYDAYGNAQSGFSGGSKYAYAGQWGYYDDGVDTGLQYLKARYYDPSTGRFVSRDPIGYAGGINVYEYVGGNPVSYIDPLGLDWLDSASNFFAGWGDTLTFGFTGWVRRQIGVDDVVDRCSGWYKGGEWTGIAHTTAFGIAGGVKAAGTRGVGKEFSHTLPTRWGAPRSIFNGNYVSPRRHYLHDPFRYPSGWQNWGNKWPAPIAQLDRIPNLYKGTAAGLGGGLLFRAVNHWWNDPHDPCFNP